MPLVHPPPASIEIIPCSNSSQCNSVLRSSRSIIERFDLESGVPVHLSPSMFRRRHSILHQFPRSTGPIRFDSDDKRHFGTLWLEDCSQDSRVCLHASAATFSSVISFEQFFSTAWSRSRTPRWYRLEISGTLVDPRVCHRYRNNRTHRRTDDPTTRSPADQSRSLVDTLPPADARSFLGELFMLCARPFSSIRPTQIHVYSPIAVMTAVPMHRCHASLFII